MNITRTSYQNLLRKIFAELSMNWVDDVPLQKLTEWIVLKCFTHEIQLDAYTESTIRQFLKEISIVGWTNFEKE